MHNKSFVCLLHFDYHEHRQQKPVKCRLFVLIVADVNEELPYVDAAGTTWPTTGEISHLIEHKCQGHVPTCV